MNASLNNWFYGPLIGRRDLTFAQRKAIFTQAHKASRKPAIAMALCYSVPLFIWQLIRGAGFLLARTQDTDSPQFTAMGAAITSLEAWNLPLTFLVIFAQFPLGIYVHRRLAAPHIRAAANSLRLSNVCTRCGYNLSGHTTTTPPTPQSLPQRCPPQVCPECGTPRTIPQSLPASCPPPAATPNAAAHTPARDEPAV